MSNAGAKLPGDNETSLQLLRMTSALSPVSLSDLFGLRSRPPLSPRAAIQSFHLSATQRSCLTVVITCVAVIGTRSAETRRLRSDVAHDVTCTQPFFQQHSIEARAAYLDCYHSTIPAFNAQPNARHQRRAGNFENEKNAGCASAACRCYTAHCRN